MKRIAIDFDETLFPTLEKVIEIYNKRYSAHLELSHITTYSLYDCLDQDVAEDMIEYFVIKKFMIIFSHIKVQ
jgi:5'(3')-deoxyribonucleotidase